ncbi:uncharacterized protein LOC126842942 isoform X2 [Adelges cooleyi]|uniref:uncharacterized protein LOC126842942 isoform X2 n=1 Tax=Adelges cooleyi TaxID=133065 RepID=UPI0021802A05|nr:uncharacterized protein LOC126842942 isoform X2 [Adelges cooleyi]
MNFAVLLLVALTTLVADISTAAYQAYPLGPVTNQYHAQDELGQYSYGYSGDLSSKHEQRTADGITRGQYSYVDANGLIQSVAYVSDPVNGFRASGTNFPVDTNAAPVPVVAAHSVAVPVAQPADQLPTVVEARHLATAPVAHYSQALTPAGTAKLSYAMPHAAVLFSRKRRSLNYLYSPAPAPVVKHVAPVVHAVPSYGATSYTSVVRHDPVVKYAAAYPVPVVQYATAYPSPYVSYAPAPLPAVAAVKSQYHAQDELGQYAYGYTDGESAKIESRSADGETKGSYSYVDDHGHVQSVHYTAGHEGFKAVGTNIPVHHV